MGDGAQSTTLAAVPLVDLTAQYEAIRPEIDAAIARVLSGAEFIMGPDVAAFEAEFAAFCGAEHCVGVGSGTAALELALRALEIGPGDVAEPPLIHQTIGARPGEIGRAHG